MGQACGNLSADSDAWIPERAAIYDPIRENSNRLAAFVLSLSLFLYLSIYLSTSAIPRVFAIDSRDCKSTLFAGRQAGVRKLW